MSGVDYVCVPYKDSNTTPVSVVATSVAERPSSAVPPCDKPHNQYPKPETGL